MSADLEHLARQAVHALVTPAARGVADSPQADLDARAMRHSSLDLTMNAYTDAQPARRGPGAWNTAHPVVRQYETGGLPWPGCSGALE